jgi:hypothetical protein
MNDIRVSPGTVTRFSEGSIKRQTRVSRRPAATTDLVSVTVDPRVWSMARRLAEGEFGRIEVVNAWQVIVHNHADWRTR